LLKASPGDTSVSAEEFRHVFAATFAFRKENRNFAARDSVAGTDEQVPVDFPFG